MFGLASFSFLFQILPGLYVGNFRDAKDLEQLKNNNITHIVSIHDNAKKILDVCIYEKERLLFFFSILV